MKKKGEAGMPAAWKSGGISFINGEGGGVPGEKKKEITQGESKPSSWGGVLPVRPGPKDT